MRKRQTINEASNKTLNEFMKDYVLNKRVQGLSERTIDYYEYRIDGFLGKVTVTIPAELIQKVIDDYILQLKKIHKVCS